MKVRLERFSSQTLKIERLETTLGSFATVDYAHVYGHVRKFAFRLDDGAMIEGLLIGTFPEWIYRLRKLGRTLAVDEILERSRLLRGRIHYDVCISTQVGCAVDCTFCASSLLPFHRNLSYEEMLAQLETLRRALPSGTRLQRVYYSGIGEPLLNAEVVFETARYLLARHYLPPTINTSGIVPAMERLFQQRLPVNLIVSIHAPNNALRQTLIPITRAYPLERIVDVLRQAPPWMFIEAKYLMLADINDSPAHAQELATLLKGLDIVITLQTYNRIAGLPYRKSSESRVRAFAEILRRQGFRVGFLNSNIGEPVEGGCGQMRIHDWQAARLSRRAERRQQREASR